MPQIEAQHPDVFLCRQFELDPDRIRQAIEAQVKKLTRPSRTYDQVLDTLAQRLLRGATS